MGICWVYGLHENANGDIEIKKIYKEKVMIPNSLHINRFRVPRLMQTWPYMLLQQLPYQLITHSSYSFHLLLINRYSMVIWWSHEFLSFATISIAQKQLPFQQHLSIYWYSNCYDHCNRYQSYDYWRKHDQICCHNNYRTG